MQIAQSWAETEDEGRLAAIAKLARHALQYGKDDSFASSAAAFAIAYCGDMQASTLPLNGAIEDIAIGAVVGRLYSHQRGVR